METIHRIRSTVEEHIGVLAGVTSVLLTTVLAGGVILTGFLNVYPFLNISGGAGATLSVDVTIALMVMVSATIARPVCACVLTPGCICLRAVIFVLVVTTVIRLLRVVLGGFLPPVCGTLNVCLPLVAAGYTILNVAVLGVDSGVNFIRSVFGTLNTNLNFVLTVLLFSNMHRHLRATRVPRFVGKLPVALISTTVITLSFLNFTKVKNWTVRVLVPIVVVTIVNLVTKLNLSFTSGCVTIPISRARRRVEGTLPNTGYNTYNFSNYSNCTTTLTRNGTRPGLYTPNNTSSTRGVTRVLGMRMDLSGGITIIYYGNDPRGAAHTFTCRNVRDYTTTGVLRNKPLSYGCNYVKLLSYMGTYPFGTVVIGSSRPAIYGSLYINYKGYIATYPGNIVGLLPLSFGATILYGGGRGNTPIIGTYRDDYVTYKVYRHMYRGSTVGVVSGLTRVSCALYSKYKGYGRTYGEGIVVWGMCPQFVQKWSGLGSFGDRTCGP